MCLTTAEKPGLCLVMFKVQMAVTVKMVLTVGTEKMALTVKLPLSSLKTES